MRPITTGALSEKITFQVKSVVEDAGGGRSKSWANISSDPSPWAKVQPVRGREPEDSGRVATIQTYLIIVRYRTDITPAHRVVYDSKNLNIRSVQDRGGDGVNPIRAFLWLECEEGVAQ